METNLSERQQDRKEIQELNLKDVVRNILEESRMVLPGIQALFGFQLIAVFNARFDDLSSPDKCVHMIAIVLTIVAIAFLMAPAAYHRQVERNTVSQTLVDYSSKMLCFGMIPLVLSLCLDTFLVSKMILENVFVSAVVSGIAFLLLLTLWYIIPRAAARKFKKMFY